MTTGLLFDIEKFAIQDGPDIRTAVFFKGCPLRCIWCHNPESQKPEPEILYSEEQCIGCGGCAQVCPSQCHQMGQSHDFLREGCLHCGRCAACCPTKALESAGREMTVEQVMDEVLTDRIFYETSHGGVTLTGGEPMAQFAFCLALLQRAKAAGLHVCMETCGYAPWPHFEQTLPFVDLFLYDVKASDPEAHKHFTGVDNILIRSNLQQLDAAGAQLILRCPLIQGVNATPSHLHGIAELANSLTHVKEIHLEPYHPLGIGKCARLGMEPLLPLKEFASEADVSQWLQTIQMGTSVPVKRV